MEIPHIKLESGSSVPQLGLGTWKLTGNDCTAAVETALKLGYTHIDTAEHYGNHVEIAEAIGGFDRSKLFITSKVWLTDLRRGDVLKACDRALKELCTDYLDLYLIHWPNPSVPLAESLGAMSELYRTGKIKSIGVSNFTIRHLEEALGAGVPISMNQVEFHPGLYQKELLDFCKERNIFVTAYSPLGRGGLIGDKTITSIAGKNGKTPAQVCLMWLVQKGMVVIPKAASEAHLKENMCIFGWKLGDADMNSIDAMGSNNRIIARGLAYWAIGALGFVGSILHR